MRLTLKLLGITIATAIIAVYTIVVNGSALNGIHSSSITDEELIRQRYPIRLVQPEWVGHQPDQPDMLFDWMVAETKARLGLVAVLWVCGVSVIIHRHLRKSTKPC